MATLADDFLAAAHLSPPDQRFSGFRHVAQLINRAHRFHISPEARDAVHSLLISKPSSLLEALTYARLPFPITWMEWTPPSKLVLGPGQYAVKRVGALMRAEGDRTIRMFTCWRHVAPPADTGQLIATFPPKLRPFAELVNLIGVSALEAAWDFRSLEGKPELNVDPLSVRGWFRMRTATESQESLRKLRDDEHNAIRFALRDPKEFEALRQIELCAAFRIHREVFGEETVRAAQETCTGMEPVIRDIEDEMGPLVALLILLNAKNCVEIAKVEPPPKLNRARIKRRQLPLVDYSTVHIKLNRPDQRYADSGEVNSESVRRHIVRGHFKLRRGGVFWWRPHLRGSEGAGDVIRKGYEVD